MLITPAQSAAVLLKIHGDRPADLSLYCQNALAKFELDEGDIPAVQQSLRDAFVGGIKVLNPKQLANITDLIKFRGYDAAAISKKLDYYEVNKSNYPLILEFCESYAGMIMPISVSQMDKNFKGVQVATNDDLEELAKQGFTGVWKITPANVKHMYVQVASMGDSGRFRRGMYLNAEITRFNKVIHNEAVRYEIHFANPVIVDSGKRDVKFQMNPVSYVN